MSLTPGGTLAHYRITREIGEGGMGAVYLAEDTRLGRNVAIKVLPDTMASDPDRLARFQREARAVAALNHPHIVTIYSVEEDHGAHFLTMELVEGESLDRRLPPGGMPLTQVFDIGIALADALAAAHDKGVVHRDLKPGNIMLTKDGRVKVLDFGLAKLAQPGASPDDVTSAPTRGLGPQTGAGMVMGTVPYMSPEQVGGEAVDARTDIFSLGVVLYELSTGIRPFKGKNQAETISSIMRDTPPPVTESRQDAPRHLARIIEHCLQKDPDSRFQTAKDVRNELRELRKELDSGHVEKSGAVPASSSIKPRSGSRRGLWLGVAAAVVAATLIAVFVIRPARHESAGTGTTAGETNSLAVLPFTNMSSDQEQEYFSDGLTEELLNALVKIPDLKVAGRTSSFSFKGKNEDLRTIGEKLGVTNILEGSVRKSGDRIRITVQLVKAADGFHIWSETYDRKLDDIFAVQDEIAKAVASALRVTLLGHGGDAPDPDADAYDLVLQARYVLMQRTADSNTRAKALLDRAMELSPNYAPAWSEMGLLHLKEVEVATSTDERLKARQRAQDALNKALELDPNLAVAHARMAGVLRDEWDFTAARRSADRALAADPKDPKVVGNASILYMTLGEFDRAIPLLEQAFRADPLSAAGRNNIMISYMNLGRVDEAEDLARKTIELMPDNGDAYAVLASILLVRGRPEEARQPDARSIEMLGLGEYGRLQSAAVIEHTAGNKAASDAATAEFEKQFGEQDPLSAARIRAWRGEKDAAFAWLDKCLAARDPYLAQVKMEVMFRSLYDDPRWNVLLEKVGLPPQKV